MTRVISILFLDDYDYLSYLSFFFPFAKDKKGKLQLWLETIYELYYSSHI